MRQEALAQRVAVRFAKAKSGQRDYKTVVIGHDNVSDWVQLPDGTKLMLGTLSVLQFVSKLAPDRSLARRALDEFLKHGEAMLPVSLSAMEELFLPRRTRW